MEFIGHSCDLNSDFWLDPFFVSEFYKGNLSLQGHWCTKQEIVEELLLLLLHAENKESAMLLEPQEIGQGSVSFGPGPSCIWPSDGA